MRGGGCGPGPRSVSGRLRGSEAGRGGLGGAHAAERGRGAARPVRPEHAERLTAPRGWEVVRLAPDLAPPRPSDDDLLALADAVREAAKPRAPEPAVVVVEAATVEVGRRGHLRVLRDPAP